MAAGVQLVFCIEKNMKNWWSEIICLILHPNNYSLNMTHLTEEERKAQMDSMRAFDEHWDLGHGWTGDM